MKVIPVIDYMHGHVVLAQHGQRASYQPVNSPLCSTSNLTDVIDSILSFMHFNTIYIADLDAITGRQYQAAPWRTLCLTYPTTEFWLDLGQHVSVWQNEFNEVLNVRPVIGTEAFQHSQQIITLLNQLRSNNPIISLDFKHQQLLGPEKFIQHCRHWPEDIIALDLDQIGHPDGTDFGFYSDLMCELPAASNLYMGGGIRNIDDLKQAQSLGLNGALIATALHYKTLSQQALAELVTDGF